MESETEPGEGRGGGREAHARSELPVRILPKYPFSIENEHLAALGNRLKQREKHFFFNEGRVFSCNMPLPPRPPPAHLHKNHYNLRCSINDETDLSELGGSWVHEWISEIRFSVPFYK